MRDFDLAALLATPEGAAAFDIPILPFRSLLNR